MKNKSQLKNLAIEQLQRGKFQPREDFDPQQLQELADSITTTGGLLQPIVVRPVNDNAYEIIAGERRWRAAQLAGLTTISCLINDYDDEQALQAAIIENVNRSNLNPIEEAKSYRRLHEEFFYNHDDIAATVGKSRTKITNTLRLLNLDEKVQQMIISGELSDGHGKILASLTPQHQCTLANLAVTKSWSVRQLEKAKKSHNTDSTAVFEHKDPNITYLEKNLSEHVGSPVNIAMHKNGQGNIQVDFQNIDILEGILVKLGFQLESS